MLGKDQPYDQPLEASVNGDQVVLLGEGPMVGALKPEAVLNSLEGMRIAAEQALRNRAAGVGPTDDDSLEVLAQ